MFNSLILWFFGVLGLIKAQEQLFVLNGSAQGTSYLIRYYATDQKIKKEEIESIFAEVDNSMSLYKPNSLIQQFNKNQQVKVDQHFKTVFGAAQYYHMVTGGYFDATLAPLMRLWSKAVVVPNAQQIQQTRLKTGMQHITLVNGLLKKHAPNIELDLNGIAQGYTVDLLARYLRSKGLKSFLVELGGEIYVQGSKPNGEAFTIALDSPDEDCGDFVPKRVQIASGAITSSGIYRKLRYIEGYKVHHIIDPFKGYPVQNDVLSVTTYAPTAMVADAFDNSLLAMGLEKALAFVAKQRNLEAYFIYRDASGNMKDTASTGFYKIMVRN
ncbi:FAD:protein FMN transferase [Pedobacter flavus]|uniref:FAD:protein FMN transferase n=1 Tax=Pedobacter flavus TaxID=3113906 RepID=A0ABU7GXW3_9SPHI|nr:FAD:protein FMN transferase [Pedobacter sp. VNH31]MEE1883800.1 FAD:protein FMN transferase [Pedobacter sp. VNH31]